MVRKLKHHEQKLLKKVDFIKWSIDGHDRILRNLIRNFCIVKREDISKYSMLVSNIVKLIKNIQATEEEAFITEMMSELQAKLYSLGLINGKDIRVSEAKFCLRRLPVMMVNKGMVEKVTEATKFVQQGHVRVGPEVIKDPAYLVTRHMEDFITWVDTSAIKQHVMEYNELRDDYDMM